MTRLLAGTILAFALLTAPADAGRRFDAGASFFKPDGLCGRERANHFDVFAFAYFNGYSDAKAQKVFRRYSPTGKGTVTVAGHTYKLREEEDGSYAQDDYALWSFETIKNASPAVLGQVAILRYKTAAGKMKLKARVFEGTCE